MKSTQNNWEENKYDEVAELIRLASDGKVDIYPEKYERIKSFIRSVEEKARIEEQVKFVPMVSKLQQELKLEKTLSKAVEKLNVECLAETTLSEGENNCACGEQTTFGDADVEIGGVCHRLKKPCYVIASQKETHLKPTVRSFITFCEAHPDYRLFQALQAWLKENGHHVEYIYLQKPHGPLEDAFYLDDIK